MNLPVDPPAEALAAITADDFLTHIRVLSSDEFEGRALGGRGEELSVDYLTGQFRRLGLLPGNPDGTYVQAVPVAGIISEPTMTLRVGGSVIPLAYPDDFVATSSHLVPKIDVPASDIVFVGYGVVAPEYGWDDYKDVDVRGKTILMLAGDPAVPDPADPSRLDERMFRGRALTYYGRWTYKYDIAAKMGAAGAILIHETEPAGYPYSVVKSSWAKEIFVVDSPDGNASTVPVRSWVTREVAVDLLARAGQDFEALKRAAVRTDFRPVPLPAQVDFSVHNAVRRFRSHNVMARLEGSDATLRDELIVYSAHWDHLGKVEAPPEPPKIFHGALDNASGVAALLGLARAFVALTPPPARSVLFFAPTAEESGLLGAKFYAEHPLYPLAKTLANINMDGMNVWGRTRDIENVSSGHSDLDELFTAAAARQGRIVRPDSQPEKGMFYRADHFEFAKEGVPALYPNAGKDVIGREEDYGVRKSKEYVANHYHQPSDQVDPEWDLTGAVEDIQLLFDVGYRLASGGAFPEWRPGAEFKPKRDQMLGRSGA